MHPHLQLSPDTSMTWPYSYTNDLHQAPRPSSSPSWSSRWAVTKNLYIVESTTFYSVDSQYRRDIMQDCDSTHLLCTICTIKTWYLILSICLCHLSSLLSITHLTYTNVCRVDIFFGPAKRLFAFPFVLMHLGMA